MTKRSRGKEGSDDRLFGDPKMQAKMREAIKDISYLLSRGFSEKSSVPLVGNRYKLNNRQQRAVQGMSEASDKLEKRAKHCLEPNQLAGKEVFLDGFNVLIMLESALSGAYLFKGLDGCYRDLSSVHGTYKKVKQTPEAIQLIANFLQENKVKKATWIFDKPVSNSGRLKTILSEFAEQHQLLWEIMLHNNPDKLIAESNQIAISSDAWVLDNSRVWCNMVRHIVDKHIPQKNVVESESKN
ncbi:DUF434 domain-containing protein [Kordia algicida OT-1]|uniref:Uncharacterized conserved protein, putative n=1 Tax=Kordia algicida OT-1 TaxID=391587 RepID=A9DK88_9FLAO|nr:DUF434 domain-containing protein [Kordia algicida]EDP98277.1 uncharacterized conserved protein, putative [Kordia algicida OT-1]